MDVSNTQLGYQMIIDLFGIMQIYNYSCNGEIEKEIFHNFQQKIRKDWL